MRSVCCGLGLGLLVGYMKHNHQAIIEQYYTGEERLTETPDAERPPRSGPLMGYTQGVRFPDFRYVRPPKDNATLIKEANKGHDFQPLNPLLNSLEYPLNEEYMNLLNRELQNLSEPTRQQARYTEEAPLLWLKAQKLRKEAMELQKVESTPAMKELEDEINKADAEIEALEQKPMQEIVIGFKQLRLSDDQPEQQTHYKIEDREATAKSIKDLMASKVDKAKKLAELTKSEQATRVIPIDDPRVAKLRELKQQAEINELTAKRYEYLGSDKNKREAEEEAKQHFDELLGHQLRTELTANKHNTPGPFSQAWQKLRNLVHDEEQYNQIFQRDYGEETEEDRQQRYKQSRENKDMRELERDLAVAKSRFEIGRLTSMKDHIQSPERRVADAVARLKSYTAK